MRISDWSSDVCSSDLGGGDAERCCNIVNVFAAVDDRPIGGDGIGGVHVLTLRVLGKRDFQRLVLAADFNGNLESAGDGLCLLQQLQGPVAPPSSANLDLAVLIIADKVLQHAPSLNFGCEGSNFLGLHLPTVEVGKRQKIGRAHV